MTTAQLKKCFQGVKKETHLEKVKRYAKEDFGMTLTQIKAASKAGKIQTGRRCYEFKKFESKERGYFLRYSDNENAHGGRENGGGTGLYATLFFVGFATVIRVC